jgi:hypothetical protein
VTKTEPELSLKSQSDKVKLGATGGVLAYSSTPLPLQKVVPEPINTATGRHLLPQTLRDVILERLKVAGSEGSKAAPIGEFYERTFGRIIHEKTVGMTLYRLQKDGLVRHEGHTWFLAPPKAETGNPGADTPGPINPPNPKHISTSFVERQNLTMRMGMRRFTRLSNGFSKKLENHFHALSLYFVHYNWMRIHKTLRVTPAMAAGLTDKLMDRKDIIAIMDAKEKDALARKRAAMLDELPYSN